MSPITPLLMLLLGVAGVLLGVLPRFRYTGLFAIAATIGALVAVLLMALRLPVSAVLSRWAPASLFSVGLVLEVDALAWLYGLGVLAATLASLVTGLARPGGSRVGTRSAILLMAAASFVSIAADNLLTRVMAWAALDLIYFLSLIFLAEGDGLEPQAVLNLSFNSIGTLLAVASAVLISRTSPSLSLRDAALTSQSTVLITLAAVFRLGLFPLHLGLPTELNIRQGLGTMLRLLPAAVALETLARLAVFGFADGLRPWLTLFACAAALAGAAQLWNASDPRQGVAYVIIAQSGVALLAGLWSDAHAALALSATGLALLLGGAALYLFNGHEEQRPWVAAMPLAGAAAMLGLPLTVGFVGAGHLYGSLMAAGGWAWLVLVVVVAAQTLLAAGLLYTALWPGPPVSAEPILAAAYTSGLGLPAILVVVLGLLPGVFARLIGLPALGVLGFEGASSIIGAIVALLTLGGGYALWRYEPLVRDRLGMLAGLPLGSIGRLHWLYRLVWSGIRGLGSVISNLAGVLEGEGAVLWTLVAGILVWLLLRG